ncbi:GNAT family N-acetyltransferase (plasmid) [Rhizobium sp. CB3060]|uniref:GNAT family N-acetyltransferase n=1 Tax=Rhizobium sp. CB3060 TaxID=3138255 RepID=UPI0021A6607B|nr:GNAT family N-acetyltransferase [Rhizobium tropici]UWU23603.1 GNAT family N-acetyltransferase [Rhizobium tropici]
MQATGIDLRPLDHSHLQSALTLSRQAGWPHRLEEWQMLLELSRGLVAVENDRVVATIFVTPYGDDVATINMVIVDESMRGRGIGRRIMQAALDIVGDRECRLVATADGLPLYESLGFKKTGEIVQQQGPLLACIAPPTVDWATAADIEQIVTLDRIAFGADRGPLIQALVQAGRLAVLREADALRGYAALRSFGRGELCGPVVAGTTGEAQDLLSFLFAARSGAFMRVDTGAETGLAPFLLEHGLAHVGGGITMHRAPSSTPSSVPSVHTFALASQALG